jgi:hypothetical protein
MRLAHSIEGSPMGACILPTQTKGSGGDEDWDAILNEAKAEMGIPAEPTPAEEAPQPPPTSPKPPEAPGDDDDDDDEVRVAAASHLH